MTDQPQPMKRLYTKVIYNCDGCPDYSEGGAKLIIGIERPFCRRGKGRYLMKEDGDYEGNFPKWCSLEEIGDDEG